MPVQQLISRWATSNRTVILTGAGMSTESGLPDFRSPSGLWRNKDPRILASINSLHTNPADFYAFYRMRIINLLQVEPNVGHTSLAQLEQQHRLSAIITQNVDRLHQAAGSHNVIELHGNLREIRCQHCDHIFPSTQLLDATQCTTCNGALRPNVVLFGEQLSADALTMADREAKQADLFIVIGSSLEVSPANYFPGIAKANGAYLVILNRDATVMDNEADLVIRDSAGEVLSQVANHLL